MRLHFVHWNLIKFSENFDFGMVYFLIFQSREPGLNRRPTHYQCVALPAELSRQKKYGAFPARNRYAIALQAGTTELPRQRIYLVYRML